MREYRTQISYPNTCRDPEVSQAASKALVKVMHWRAGAQSAVNANLLDYLTGMLESPKELFQGEACRLIEALASHKEIRPAIVELRPCVRLVYILQ